jgi:hypothetical protein
MGSVVAIEGAGGVVLEGVCFYQMHARALVEANAWRPLMTDSAKRVNVMADVPGETAGTRVATALDRRICLFRVKPSRMNRN